MSKKSRAKAKERRKKEKAARKKTNQEKYQKWRDLGINTKSKRSFKGKRKGPRARNHPHGECGNPACQHCYGLSFKAFLRKGEPHNMPHWMWLKWSATQE